MEQPGPVESATTTETVASDGVSPTERRLRRLSGRNATYRGPIIAFLQGWVSRDGSLHMFAARFRDYAVLTPEHLVLCSTGFFTRRPRRRVFREPLSRLVVFPRGTEPVHALRIVGDFQRPIILELKDNPESIAFAAELIARTKTEVASGPLSNMSTAPDPWVAPGDGENNQPTR